MEGWRHVESKESIVSFRRLWRVGRVKSVVSEQEATWERSSRKRRWTLSHFTWTWRSLSSYFALWHVVKQPSLTASAMESQKGWSNTQMKRRGSWLGLIGKLPILWLPNWPHFSHVGMLQINSFLHTICHLPLESTMTENKQSYLCGITSYFITECHSNLIIP